MPFQATLPEAPSSGEVAEQLRAAADYLRGIPSEGRSAEQAADARSAIGAIHELDALHSALSTVERAERAAQMPEVRGPNAAFAQGDHEMRSPGQQFVESENWTGRSGWNSGEVEVRNLLTGSDLGTSGSNLFAPVGTPFLAPQGVRRQNFVIRDLLSVQGTGLQSIPYIRELNSLANEGGASAVSEASAKPEVTMQFESADAPVRKIAAWIQATMEAVEDAPTLRGYIDTRLAYMLLVREEQQVLNGTGTAPQIEGILQVTGIQTQAAVAGDVPATVGAAIGKIENVDGMADGIAMNPLDFWEAVVTRHSSQFDGGGLGGLPFSSAPLNLWGLPVVRTRALAQTQAVVGAFRLGATLYERMGVTIRTSDSHASLFISNTLVILAEERVALAVHRPDFFVDTTIDTSA